MLNQWFMSLRPWSFTASVVPVVLGSLIAWNQGFFHPFLFLLTLVGGIAIQAGTNLINTYGDYMSGVDTIESNKTTPQLVRHIFRPEQVKRAGIAFFLGASMIGAYLVWLLGWPLLVVGILGIAGGYGYTAGIAYKYQGLGSTLVFFLMGPLMVWGAYFVQAGKHSWLAVWASLPISFLVSCILHANDLRDLDHDHNAGIKTMALLLGRKISISLYYALTLAAYLSLMALIALKILPLLSILPLLLLPQVRCLIKDVREAAAGNDEKLDLLEAGAALHHFKFGVLLTAGLLVNLVI